MARGFRLISELLKPERSWPRFGELAAAASLMGLTFCHECFLLHGHEPYCREIQNRIPTEALPAGPLLPFLKWLVEPKTWSQDAVLNWKPKLEVGMDEYVEKRQATRKPRIHTGKCSCRCEKAGRPREEWCYCDDEACCPRLPE